MMFTTEQKQEIAAKIEKILLEINHPNMPTERPLFELHVSGKEWEFWSDIVPNWLVDDKKEIALRKNEYLKK